MKWREQWDRGLRNPEGAAGFNDANLARIGEAFVNTTGNWEMQSHTVKLIDQSGQVLATAQVFDEGAQYGRTIDLGETPANIRALFDEFEEIVNGQMFSFLDEVQEKIDSLNIKAVFDNEPEVDIKNLQVFPSAGEASFKLAKATGILNGRLAGRGVHL